MPYYHRCVVGILLVLWTHTVLSLQVIPIDRLQRKHTILREFPPNGNPFDNSSDNNDGSTNDANAETIDHERDDNGLPTGQANTRFSKFAPDPNLETSDFRIQLRENMKADLERRRNENPNRGNQVAKHYLDSL